MKGLRGKNVLVTGGSSGIGQAIAIRLGAEGANVAVNYRRDAEAAQDAVAAIQGLGRRARAFRASVDRWEEDQEMVAEALREFGHIDILVNNAGIASRGLSVADTDPAELERVLKSGPPGVLGLPPSQKHEDRKQRRRKRKRERKNRRR